MNTQLLTILQNLPRYEGKKTLVVREQQTFDIVREIMKMHEQTAPHYDKIAREHWKKTPIDTARHLFYFIKSHLPYEEEKNNEQTVKQPQAILSERLTFGNDCKHYSSYINGVGSALCRMGYPISCLYRFASYDKDKRTPGHVFAVWVIDGREYWIDPVPQIGGFNKRTIKPYYFTDKRAAMANIGSLYVVGGVGATRGKKLHVKLKPGKFLKKIALAPNRNAFLLYLKLNLFHTGSQIVAKMQQHPEFKNKFFALWAKLGGNANKLQTALTQAVNVWNKHHPNRRIGPATKGTHNITIHRVSGTESDGMGAAPAAVPAIIAAAAPIIAAFSALLKSVGISHAKDGDIKDAEDKTIDDHNEATENKGDGKKDINPDGSVTHDGGVTTKVGEDATGKQVLNYGATDGGGTADGALIPGGQIEATTPAGSTADNPAVIALTSIKDFVSEHKTAFIVGGVGLAAVIILPKILAHKTKHRK